MKENVCDGGRSFLFVNCYKGENQEFENLKENFCGNVVYSIDKLESVPNNSILYICGDGSCFDDVVDRFINVYIIGQLSYNFLEKNAIDIGAVPIFNGVGVYFRKFFDSSDYFNKIVNEHKFQELTESNKPNKALRKGIYMTNVEDKEDGVHFNLLRCSSNFDGPTDNFRKTDHEIINKLNKLSRTVFRYETDMNHTLAQIYENSLGLGNNPNKERKAKIKQHSDKTKDMPQNGLIAFCTFYKNYNNGFAEKELKKSKSDTFDWCYKGQSVLTKLRFKLKTKVDNLPELIDVKLYPDSVFMISLEMNRLYTHEIVPSQMPVGIIPTRMGYVVRCSNCKAVYKNNSTYILEDGKEIPLEQPYKEGIDKLKEIYRQENLTTEFVDYGFVDFSLNKSDYVMPIV